MSVTAVTRARSGLRLTESVPCAETYFDSGNQIASSGEYSLVNRQLDCSVNGI
jgi:hypothetical protein